MSQCDSAELWLYYLCVDLVYIHMQVNDIAMWGKTHDEAVSYMIHKISLIVLNLPHNY